MTRKLREFFSIGDAPVKPVPSGSPVHPDTRWKLIDKRALTKAYQLSSLEQRDLFVVRCLAAETSQRKSGVSWVIDGTTVTVSLRVENIGLTENVVEFARSLDSACRDVQADSEVLHAQSVYSFA